MDSGKRTGLEYGAPTRNAFGETLKEIGGENPNLVVLDGDVGTRRTPTTSGMPTLAVSSTPASPKAS
jgi:hypothetical protein